MTSDSSLPSDFEADLQRWLREDIGMDEPRRFASLTADEIRLSKHDPAFLRQLFELVDRFSELFDEMAVLEAYAREAAASPPESERVATWAAAAHRMLRDAGARDGVPEPPLAELRTGIDTVEAILQSVLSSSPRVGDAYAPSPREVSRYREMLATLRDDDVFVRFYGTFRGRAVRDYCPAVGHAHVMLAHAWRSCTGTPPPTA